MLDRTIPFYNAILKCNSYKLQQIAIPKGCQIVTYQPGFEKDWARMEYKAGDFDSEEEARLYFCEKYCLAERGDDILFLKIRTGQLVGSSIAWMDKRKDALVNSLHWLIVDDEYQGKGYGRLLCTAIMNQFCYKGKRPIYIHTQPWSWKAIFLYLSLGFRLQKTDSFNSYINQYDDVIRTLSRILPDKQIRYIEEKTDE